MKLTCLALACLGISSPLIAVPQDARVVAADGEPTLWTPEARLEREHRVQLALGLNYGLMDGLSMVAGLDMMYDEDDLPSILHVLKSAQGDLNAGDVREATSVRQGIEAFLNGGAFLQALWTPIADLLSLTGGVRPLRPHRQGEPLVGGTRKTGKRGVD